MRAYLAAVIALGAAACTTQEAVPAHCDFTSSRAAADAQHAEPVPQTLGDEPVTMCGRLDDDNAVHVFALTKAGAADDLLVRMTSPAGEDVGALKGFKLFARVEQGTNQVTAWYEHDEAVVDGSFDAGPLLVTVGGARRGDVNYAVTVIPHAGNRPALTTPPDYVEAQHGDGNDMSPEVTNLIVNAGGAVHIRGENAMLPYDANHNRDPDTFGFRAGPDTSEVTVRADWPGAPTQLMIEVYRGGGSGQMRVSSGKSGPLGLTLSVLPTVDYAVRITAAGDTGVPAIPYDLSIYGDSTPP